jgi:hypothetical protein
MGVFTQARFSPASDRNTLRSASLPEGVTSDNSHSVLGDEDRAFGVVVFDSHLTTVICDECFDQIEANPCACAFQATVALTEDGFFLVVGNAGAIVCDPNSHCVVVIGCRDFHLCNPLVVVLYRVLQQIPKDRGNHVVGGDSDRGNRCLVGHDGARIRGLHLAYEPILSNHPDRVTWGMDASWQWRFNDWAMDTWVDVARALLGKLPQQKAEQVGYETAAELFGITVSQDT